MKKSFWRKLAQRLAYPRWWPTCFAFWNPIGAEVMPPRLGISINGRSAWYRIERQPTLNSNDEAAA